jgi:Mce-associated membrane protein
VALAIALVVLLTLVVLGALGLLGNTGIGEVQEAEDAEIAAESAPSVAERAAAAILAYDHKALDDNRDQAAKFMTSSFAEEYATTFDKTVKPAARTYKAQVTADVRGSSVVRASDDRVLVLLFIDQTTRSTAHQQPQVALNRVQFEMVESDGEWLVDDISSF